MKYLFYIALSFLVFTACEDEKDTLPYPMIELDGTFWGGTSYTYHYYDEKGVLIKESSPDFYWEGALPEFFFKGNAVLEMHYWLSCDEYLYTVSWKDQQLIIGSTSYDLVECNESNLSIRRTYFTPSSDVPGSCSYTITTHCYRRDPRKSFEKYIEDYKRYGDLYVKHY